MSEEVHGDEERTEDIRSYETGPAFKAAALGAAITDDLRKRTEGMGAIAALAQQSPVLTMIGQQMASSAAEHVIAAAAPITEQIRQQMLDLDRLVEPFQEIMTPWMDAHRTMTDRLHRRIDENENDAKVIGPFFEEAGLWLSYGMPLSLWGETRRLYHDGHLDAPSLKAAVLATFHNDDYKFMKTTVDDWWDRPEFQRWQHVIDDAFWAHRKGKYTLSVPALIPVSEAIMRDVCGDEVARMPTLAEKIGTMVSSWSFSAVSDEPFVATLSRFTKREGYADPVPDSEVGRWHRHRILHGRDPTYNTDLNSLRLFILLDELKGLIVTRDNKRTRSRNAS